MAETLPRPPQLQAAPGGRAAGAWPETPPSAQTVLRPGAARCLEGQLSHGQKCGGWWGILGPSRPLVSWTGPGGGLGWAAALIPGMCSLTVRLAGVDAAGATGVLGARAAAHGAYVTSQLPRETRHWGSDTRRDLTPPGGRGPPCVPALPRAPPAPVVSTHLSRKGRRGERNGPQTSRPLWRQRVPSPEGGPEWTVTLPGAGGPWSSSPLSFVR